MPVPALLISAPGPWELMLILVLVMIFFGVGKLPEVGKAIGKSIKSFKDAQKDDSIDVTPKQIDAAGEEVANEQRDRAKV
jgi:sec-independent protein translocase protein TatA